MSTFSENEIRELDRQVDFAVDNMGPEYVAEKLGTSVDVVESLCDRQTDWTEDLARRMKDMMEELADLEIVPAPPADEPETGKDPPPAEAEDGTTAQTPAQVAKPQGQPPADATQASPPPAPAGRSAGSRRAQESASTAAGPPKDILELLAEQRAIIGADLMIRRGGSPDKTDREAVRIILEATALLGYGHPVPGEELFTPDQEITRLDELADEFRSKPKPRRAKHIREKLHATYYGSIFPFP